MTATFLQLHHWGHLLACQSWLLVLWSKLGSLGVGQEIFLCREPLMTAINCLWSLLSKAHTHTHTNLTTLNAEVYVGRHQCSLGGWHRKLVVGTFSESNYHKTKVKFLTSRQMQGSMFATPTDRYDNSKNCPLNEWS